MNLQQAVQPRSSANGFNRLRVEKENSRMEIKPQPGKPNTDRVISTAMTSGSRSVGPESPSRDRLVYVATCLIGQHVDVHVKNGSVYSGIFHATNADKDFGVILKMARLSKDASARPQKTASDAVVKAPSKTFIIPAHELVQVVAKDVSVSGDGSSNEASAADSKQDIMLDSYISHSRHVDVGRELAPWMPDKDDPLCPDLENVFDSPWTGSWDQFKVNETLFGVKSTFNEELYTTKLEKGPRTRQLEEEALRIAREIEGEDTQDLHLAEERGVNPYGDLDIDEETKYSSVFRGIDDSGCEDEDVLLNSRDAETFGDSSGPAFGRSFADVTSGKSGKGFEGGRAPSRTSIKDELHLTQFNARPDFYRSDSLASNHSASVDKFEDDNRVQENDAVVQGGNTSVKEILIEEVHTAKTDIHTDLQPSRNTKRTGSEKAGVSLGTATTSDVNTKVEAKTSSGELSEDRTGKMHVVSEPINSRGRPGSSASSTSETGAATSAPGVPALSPSSSMGSLSSEKSTLNPNAKEFKFNPNAKSFVPSQSPLRPPSPVNDASFYYPTTMPAVPHMHGMPVGIGVGPSFAGPQPMLFNPQAAAMQPQAYFAGNAPQYGQQMILGHPRQVMYMPGYPGEMQYKGREY